MGLSKEDQDLAELIGLLHDIGRFEQVRLYHTFSDKISIDHGQKGVEVLFADKWIRKFSQDETYDTIIYLKLKKDYQKKNYCIVKLLEMQIMWIYLEQYLMKNKN